MDRLKAYEVFVAVAEAGSFNAAARRLGLSAQGVTRAIQALESHLDQLLLHRSTRALSLTAQGAALLPAARQALQDLADAEQALRGARAEPSGELHVTAPVMFGRLHVVPAVAQLLARHDKLDVRLLLVDRNIRLVEEGIDLALRIGRLADSALMAARIGQVRPAIVASPAYLARRGVPASAAELSGHDLIVSTGPRGSREWRGMGRHRLHVNTVDSMLAAVESGIGLANLLSYQVADGIAAGRLIEVLQPDEPEWLPVSLLFEGARARAPATRAFITAMKQRATESGLN